jgi:tetratricopeptide (TPR) repeat protein
MGGCRNRSQLFRRLLGRGNAFAALERYDEAVAAYNRVLTLKPDLVTAWLALPVFFTLLALRRRPGRLRQSDPNQIGLGGKHGSAVPTPVSKPDDLMKLLQLMTGSSPYPDLAEGRGSVVATPLQGSALRRRLCFLR